MFTGELDYTDIPMQHWLGQLLFLIFIFLIVVVIMNLLNGLAVSDIQKIYKVRALHKDDFYKFSPRKWTPTITST